MVHVCVEMPKWIFDYTDVKYLEYEVSKLVRDTIAILTERPRKSREAIIARAIAKLIIARVAVETLISVTKLEKDLRSEEIIKAIEEALKKVSEVARK